MLQMVESATCNYKYFELKTLTLCGKKHSEGVFMMRKISKYLFFWARAWDGRNLSGNRRFAVPYL